MVFTTINYFEILPEEKKRLLKESLPAWSEFFKKGVGYLETCLYEVSDNQYMVMDSWHHVSNYLVYIEKQAEGFRALCENYKFLGQKCVGAVNDGELVKASWLELKIYNATTPMDDFNDYDFDEEDFDDYDFDDEDFDDYDFDEGDFDDFDFDDFDDF